MRVNGKEIPLERKLSLYDFLQEQEYSIHRIAVERNGQIVQRQNYKDIILLDSDRIEVVSFVGGG